MSDEIRVNNRYRNGVSGDSRPQVLRRATSPSGAPVTTPMPRPRPAGRIRWRSRKPRPQRSRAVADVFRETSRWPGMGLVVRERTLDIPGVQAAAAREPAGRRREARSEFDARAGDDKLDIPTSLRKHHLDTGRANSEKVAGARILKS